MKKYEKHRSDEVISHGLFCLSKMVHEENINRVKAIMDKRLAELEA